MFKTFGTTKEVFANQDEGLFAAFPITLDENVLTLETLTEGGRTYVLEGSVVKEGSVVRGITAERYDITYGPKPGRVVLEGYAWASALTPNALAAVASLPKIVVMPFMTAVFTLDEIVGLRVRLTVEGIKFKDDIEISDVTVTDLTISSVTFVDDRTMDITFTAAGTGTITAIDATALIGSSGVGINLPITLTVAVGDKHAVTATAGTKGTVAVDKETAAEGEIVTITATPSAGYVVDEIKLDGAKLTAVEGAYTFVMKATAVAVTASFKVEG